METIAIATHSEAIAIATHLGVGAIVTYLGTVAPTTHWGTVVTTSDLHHLKLLLINTHIIKIITSVTYVRLFSSKVQEQHPHLLKYRTITSLKGCADRAETHTLL